MFDSIMNMPRVLDMTLLLHGVLLKMVRYILRVLNMLGLEL